MCNSLQLTSGEVLKTEAAIRRILGPASEKWLFAPRGVRAEGIEITDGKDGKSTITWGTERRRDPNGVPQDDPKKKIWRGKVHKIFTAEIRAFYDPSLDSRPHPIRFDAIQGSEEPGLMMIPVFEHFELPTKIPRFSYLTIQDPRVAALTKIDRGLLTVSLGTDPVSFLRELHWALA